jgi:hypothetical protein
MDQGTTRLGWARAGTPVMSLVARTRIAQARCGLLATPGDRRQNNQKVFCFFFLKKEVLAF